MMELGLFSLLDKQRLDAEEIAQKLQIPNRRCNYWLQILQSTGLIEAGEGGYDLSTVARTAILDSYSLSTWSYLAVEAREWIPAVKDLANQICEPGSTWEAQGLTPPNYVEEMIKSPARAERFTRMLYEIHQPLAEEIANALDVEEVEQLSWTSPMFVLLVGRLQKKIAWRNALPTLRRTYLKTNCPPGLTLSYSATLGFRMTLT